MSFRMSDAFARPAPIKLLIDLNLDLAEVQERMTPEQIAALFYGIGKIVEASNKRQEVSG